MLKFFERVPKSSSTGSSSTARAPFAYEEIGHPKTPINLSELISDLGLRKNIYDYHSDDREKVRRAYLQKELCQPRNHNFPLSDRRSFVISWYKEFDWLEYSIAKDAAYCCCCYLFKPNHIYTGGGDAFLIDGFRNWKKKERFRRHIGDHNSTHSQCLKACEDLLHQRQHIEICLSSQSDQVRANYRVRLNASVDCVHYVHCFAHQLQLTLVAVAKKHTKIGAFFEIISLVSNVVGASCKRRDVLREKQAEKVIKKIGDGELVTGKGLNQETTLKRAGDTRWGSHFGTIVSFINLFSSVVDVLLLIGDIGDVAIQRIQADDLCERIQTFQFTFCLHLMKMVLGITNDFSQALQRKDQDIVNAMNMVRICKQQLQSKRDDGWESLLTEVPLFCIENSLRVPIMEDKFETQGKSRRKVQGCTNLYYYKVELFYAIIDLQLQELNDRFTELNTELLLCMSCLDPSDSFCAYDLNKVIQFARFYPSDFDEDEISYLGYQLTNYIADVRSSEQFSDVMGISGLARKLVQTKRHQRYPLVYLLIKLALILPVATATVERVFSAMKIIKTQLHNRLGDEFMNDCLIAYIERDISTTLNNEDIMQHFQNMNNRRGSL